MRLDRIKENNKWQEATDLDFKQLDDYEIFLDLGHMDHANPPEKFSWIWDIRIMPTLLMGSRRQEHMWHTMQSTMGDSKPGLLQMVV